MMKLIKLMAFGMIVFGTAAGGSWFARMQQHKTEVAATGQDGDADHAATEPHEVHADAAPDGAHAPDAHGADEELPVVVRPRMETVEDIIRNAQVLKAREEKLTQRERAAEQEQLRLQLVQSDLQGEQTSIESLAADVRAEIESANQLLVRINEEKTLLDDERQKNELQMKEFDQKKTEFDTLEQQNLKQLSTWIQGMDADAASQFIIELTRDGKMDVAVQLLANFEEREASKILSALKDPRLMAELAEKFRTLQRPTKTARAK